jgi:hypothetical protein
MSDFTQEQVHEILNNLAKIQSRVSVICRKRADWISAQVNNSRQHIGWGFIIGSECVFLTDEEAMHDPEDKEFINRLATLVMGYAPNSREDYEQRRQEANGMVGKLRMEMSELEKQHQYWMAVEADLFGKLLSLDDKG